MKYTTLLLDIDDTILDFGSAERKALEIAITATSLPYGDEVFDAYHAINESLWKSYERGEIEKNDIRVLRFARLFEAMGWTSDSLITGQAYIDQLSKRGEMIEGAREFLETVARSFDLYAVTNGIETVQRGRFKAADIDKYFLDVFISERVGYGKPDVRYFEYIFKHIRETDRARIIVVGDSPTSDIRGAQNAGLDSVWYIRRNSQLPDDVSPTYRAE